MGLFRPYDSSDAADRPAEVATDDAAQHPEPEQGKGAPTLSRREAEQLRRERMRPTLSKREQKARQREIRRVREEKAYQDAEVRPERVLLRNFVDARWTFSEFSWPLLFLAMSLFIAGTWFPQLALYASYAIWAIMVGVIIEVTFMWSMYKRLLAQRAPTAPRRGLLMYMASRMVAMRRFRRPPAALDRGAQY